ncbi:P-loop containing nucleoside triphosphate hydrolase protein [Crucibulum laeve]|uniref:P-loop containing nucleoside triphosphate hydrolase protein n=1 Tax=Crucibulum laeve TaxID=68775 RepID=A0A5C3LKU5_9AGAR|nr:P-loop containing nucleoside triphosphate hydrolase protein [Crucibulum laeve]
MLDELRTSFDDICIPSQAVESLRTIISLRLLFPDAFRQGVLERESIGGVLLFGPPGTGKTMLCRAVARECGACMLHIKPSDVLDCYVGESEKLIRAIFSIAYRLSPCLIFIDEVDSCFQARKSDDKKWVRDMISEFLQSMDGLRTGENNKGVIVIGATNRPQDIDEAVLRRLPSRMMIDLPGVNERKKILALHLRGEKLDDSLRLEDIASRTTNYSGSDLKSKLPAIAETVL